MSQIRGLHWSHYMVGLLRQADGAIEVERDAEVVTDSRVGNVACEHPALTENIVGVGKDDLREFVAPAGVAWNRLSTPAGEPPRY
jgi:hypothetical protein